MASNRPAKWVNGTLRKHLPLEGSDQNATGYIRDVSADGNRLAGYSTGPSFPWYWVHWSSSTNALPTSFWHWAALQTFESMADNGDLLVGHTYENGQYRAAYFQISTGFTSWLWQTDEDADNYAYGVSANGSTIVGASHLMGDPNAERQAVVWRGLAGTLPDLLGVAGSRDRHQCQRLRHRRHRRHQRK